MSDKSIIGLSRLMALQQAVDSIANNVANQGTVGFKAERLNFREYLSAEKERPDEDWPAVRSSLVDIRSFTDFSSGPLVATGNPLNAAVAGDGFFAVQTRGGERYTRNGAFQVDPAGRLVTTSGDPVLTTSGPLTLSPQDQAPSISADGSIVAAGKVVGRLRVVRFADPRGLSPEGGNLFRASRPPEEVAPGAIRLVQGNLEKANVSAVMEMSRLMEVSNAYKLTAAVVMKDDDTNELGRLAGTE